MHLVVPFCILEAGFVGAKKSYGEKSGAKNGGLADFRYKCSNFDMKIGSAGLANIRGLYRPRLGRSAYKVCIFKNAI
jgi:hypothetical protein